MRKKIEPIFGRALLPKEAFVSRQYRRKGEGLVLKGGLANTEGGINLGNFTELVNQEVLSSFILKAAGSFGTLLLKSVRN